MHLMEPTVPCSCGPAFGEEPGQAYNEAAFRYLLETERQRAERASRSLVLLLVNLRHGFSMRGRIAPSAASKLFAGLSLSVREVDFIGWYRDQRIAGAVLTQGLEAPSQGARREIRQRVTRVLANQLPEHLVDEVQVRVVQLNPKRKS